MVPLMPARYAALVAVLAFAMTAPASSAVTQPAGAPVYAVMGGMGDMSISRRNPRTLAQMGPAAPLGEWEFAAGLSPDGSMLAALALNSRPRSIRFLDVVRMRWRRTAVELPNLGLDTVRWIDGRTVLVIGMRPDGLRVLTVDAERGRIVRRVRVPAQFEDRQYAEPTSAGTALLLRPLEPRQLGPVIVGVVRPSGAVKVVEISGVVSGYVKQPRRPALIADPVAGTAYVVGGLDEPIAEVDLRTLRVTYHMLPGGGTLGETLGSDRNGVWIGPNRLALFGFDDLRQETRSLGLSILDTRTWGLRKIDPAADFVVKTGGLLLARHMDGSLAVYGLDGKRRFSVAEQLFEVGTVAGNGRYVYTWNLPPRPDGSDGGALVVDSTSRSVVARPAVRALNVLLSPGL